MAIAIDTQKAFDRFVNAGFNKKQAQALVEFETKKEHSHLATREDIILLDAKIDKKIDSLKIWFLGAMLTQTIALVALFLSL